MKRSLPTSEVPPTSSSSTTTQNHPSYFTSTFPSTSPSNTTTSSSTMPIGEESHQTLSHPSHPSYTSSSHTSSTESQPQPFRPHSSLYFTSSTATTTKTTPSSSSSSSSLDSSSTHFLDCQSMTHSLKRVKISTSPGELRLNKDLADMITSHFWTTATTSSSSQKFKELLSKNQQVKLERDVVDPLRLKLSVLVKQKQSCCCCWVFLIQVPRMYPHTPPVVYRVSVLPYGEEEGKGENVQMVVLSSSNTQKNVVPPVLESVVVLSADPHNVSSQPNEEGEELTNVETYQDWSPISRFVDLVHFLVELPLKRQQKWEEYVNNPQKQHVKRKEEDNEKKVLQRQITNEFSDLIEAECKKEGNSEVVVVDVQSRQYQQQQQGRSESFQANVIQPGNNYHDPQSFFLPTSKHVMTISQCHNDDPPQIKSNNIHFMESGEKSGEYPTKQQQQQVIFMQEDYYERQQTLKKQTPITLQAKKHSSFLFNPNRFDVGYDTRHIPPPSSSQNTRMVSCTMEEEEEEDGIWEEQAQKQEWREHQLSREDNNGYKGQFVGEGEVSAGGKNGVNWTLFRQSSVDSQMMME